MSTNPKRRYSVKEYFEIEKNSDIKHEYIYGEIFAMVGASRNHNRIANAINTSLYMQFLNTTCESFISDTRARVNDDLYYYPDVVVACSPEFQVIEGIDNLINPILIVEVLSRSTARFDREAKFREYQQIQSLGYYLLISQNEVNATLFTRQDNNSWTPQNYNNLTDFIELPTINSRLSMRDIYLRVQFQ
ncbi:MAG: hypothetical protein FD167_1731 [bacterium]|nr:MAG: hypothetical protein FD167_1731 [bacterium]